MSRLHYRRYQPSTPCATLNRPVSGSYLIWKRLGHFHATVVIGTTLAFMAITYFLIPTLFNREMILPGFAKWQPYLFGFGMALVCLALMGAGTLGVPRRHWDISFAGAGQPYEYPGTARRT